MGEPNANSVSKNGWTPALLHLSLSVMERMSLKASTSFFSEQLQNVRTRLIRSQYERVSDWASDVHRALATAPAPGGADERAAFDIVRADLEEWFMRRYRDIADMSHFRFRSLVQRALEECNPQSQQ